LGTFLQERKWVKLTVGFARGQSKFYFLEAGGKGAVAEAVQTLPGGLGGVVQAGRGEKQVGDQTAFLVGFQQGIKMIATGPGIVFELGEEAIEQYARGVIENDPVVGQATAEGGAEFLEVHADQQQILFGRDGAGDGGRRGGVGGIGVGQAPLTLKTGKISGEG
jgi:hypothetical protein